MPLGTVQIAFEGHVFNLSTSVCLPSILLHRVWNQTYVHARCDRFAGSLPTLYTALCLVKHQGHKLTVSSASWVQQAHLAGAAFALDAANRGVSHWQKRPGSRARVDGSRCRVLQSEPANLSSRRGQGQIWAKNLENTLGRSRGAIRRYFTRRPRRRPWRPLECPDGHGRLRRRSPGRVKGGGTACMPFEQSASPLSL